VRAAYDPAVIAGAHTIIYSEDAEAARAFFRDVLGFPSVDAGEGWLVFASPPAELALHPGPGWGRAVGEHELFFMCHDVERTVAELEKRNVEFTAPISDEGFGLMTRFKIPGGGEIGLYEPKHPSPLAEFPQGYPEARRSA
jgi:catechol 2,3-dioxygenase-like lactoylglutathione lyase family enzyme